MIFINNNRMLGLFFPKNYRKRTVRSLVVCPEFDPSAHVTLGGSYSYETASIWSYLWYDDVHSASYPDVLQADISAT